MASADRIMTDEEPPVREAAEWALQVINDRTDLNNQP